jgi:hypothetical protein
VSRNGLGNAVVRRPWQVEYARSLRLHIVPAKLNRPTAACYCPGGDRRGQFCYHSRGGPWAKDEPQIILKKPGTLRTSTLAGHSVHFDCFDNRKSKVVLIVVPGDEASGEED